MVEPRIGGAFLQKKLTAKSRYWVLNTVFGNTAKKSIHFKDISQVT